LLSSLSEEYSKQDSPEDVEFVLDLAEKHLNEVKLERLQAEIGVNLSRGRSDLSLVDMESFRRVKLKTPPFVDVLTDRKAQKKALQHRESVLIRMPGAAGEFFGDELAEDSFIAFMAVPKGGKSFSLLDVAWHGLRQGNKVAYMQIGDMSQSQIMGRFLRRAAYRPLKAKTYRMPVSMVVPQEYRGLAVVDYENRVFAKDLSWKTAQKALEKVKARTQGDLRLSYHPIKTASVLDVRSILEQWDRDGWTAKVVCIDYADNLAPVDPKAVGHEQTAQTWALLRQLSEVRKCLVATAQQSNAEGFSTWVLTRKHFSGSKMILAHPTALIGVNSTSEESSQGVVRYNFVVRRGEGFSETKCLYCASCLEVANPCVLSSLPG
jgi:hypothetical protein